jgi:hypothetical protein
VEAARPGGPGVAGFGPVVEALVQYRVEWLVLDFHCPFDGAGLSPAAAEALRCAPPDLLAQRAVAVAGGAGVSARPVADSAQLAEAGGIAATLRY